MKNKPFKKQEPQKKFTLQITETPKGKFHRCMFQGTPITEKELLKRILKTDKPTYPLSNLLREYQKENRFILLTVNRLKSVF